jgi:hypothetical protein
MELARQKNFFGIGQDLAAVRLEGLFGRDHN